MVLVTTMSLVIRLLQIPVYALLAERKNEKKTFWREFSDKPDSFQAAQAACRCPCMHAQQSLSWVWELSL